MIAFFGILRPSAGPAIASDEAPLKKSFFGGPLEAAAEPPAMEEDALYLNGKWPEPPDRGSPRSLRKQ